MMFSTVGDRGHEEYGKRTRFLSHALRVQGVPSRSKGPQVIGQHLDVCNLKPHPSPVQNCLMNAVKHRCLIPLFLAALAIPLIGTAQNVGVGAKPIPGAEIIIDGSRTMLDEKWTYWEGPRFASALPIKWKIVDDPVDKGTVVMTDDRAEDGGK